MATGVLEKSTDVGTWRMVVRASILFSSSLPSSRVNIVAWDLRTDLSRAVALLVGHTAMILDLQLKQSKLYSCSEDGSLRIWDATALEDSTNVTTIRTALVVYQITCSPVTCMQLSGADNSIFGGYQDGMIRIWEGQTSPSPIELIGHTDKVTALTTSTSTDDMDTKIVSTSLDGTIRTWSTSLHTCLLIVQVNAPLRGVVLQGDFAFLRSLAWNEVQLWDMVRKRIVRKFEGHSLPMTCFRVTQNYLYTASYDQTIRRFDIQTGVCDIIFVGHQDVITSLTMSSFKVISGSLDGDIRVWNMLNIQDERKFLFVYGVPIRTVVRGLSLVADTKPVWPIASPIVRR